MRGKGRTGSIHSPPHDLSVRGTSQILKKSGRIRDGRKRIRSQGRRILGIRHHLEVGEARLTMSQRRGRGVGEESLPVREREGLMGSPGRGAGRWECQGSSWLGLGAGEAATVGG
jgi:hypothetical protein